MPDSTTISSSKDKPYRTRFMLGQAISALAAALTLAASAGAAPDKTLHAAPVNPAYIEYQKDLADGKIVTVTKDGHHLGYIPPKYRKNNLTGKSIITGVHTQRLRFPKSYDLRTYGKVSPVKDQGNCGSCWAFAAMGAVESVLMPSETRIFSENNLKNVLGADHCDGSEFDTPENYFARWQGPINETDDPYNVNSYVSPPGLTVQKHVLEDFWIPARTGPDDNNNLKWALMNYGAVSISFLWDDPSFNTAYNAYYYNGNNTYNNHAVTLIGWDDDFDGNKFDPPAPGDGAFILKNSWSASWGDNGFFYISYHDKASMHDPSMVYAVIESSYARTTNYQYDTDGYKTFTGYASTEAWTANIFTSSGPEAVSAIGFYNSDMPTAYDAYVYLNVGTAPVSGTPAASFSGQFDYKGYHVVSLPEPVAVSSGTRFSVVIKLTNDSDQYPIATSLADHVAQSSISFVSQDGLSWQNISSLPTGTDGYYYDYVSVKALMQSLPQPHIASVSPFISMDKNPAELTIDGANFQSGAEVKLSRDGASDVTASTVTLVSAGRISCTFEFPEFVPATWTVTVINPDLSSATLVNGFQTDWNAPSILDFSPSSATNTGSVPLTIIGASFHQGLTVTLKKRGFTDISATDVTVVSTGAITCTLPLNGAPGGLWDLRIVDTSSKTAEVIGIFTVDNGNQPPEISTVTPSALSNSEINATLAISGENFQSGAAVRLEAAGLKEITSTVTFVSASALLCEFSPENIAGGSWTVRVINPDGWDTAHTDSLTVNSGWVYTGNTLYQRSWAAMIMLADGRALFGGGSENTHTELYDPASGIWSATGDLNYYHQNPQFALLPDGRVFLPETQNNPSEIYDPETGLWTVVKSRMHEPGDGDYTVTVLPDGRVLVAGGRRLEGENPTANTEIFDPASELWLSAAPLDTPRNGAAAEVLPDGRVLVAGGNGPDSADLGSAEIYDPASDSWTYTGSLDSPYHQGGKMFARKDGKIMMAGGQSVTRMSEIYTPASGTWGEVKPNPSDNYYGRSAFLPDERIMTMPQTINTDRTTMYHDDTKDWKAASVPLHDQNLGSMVLLKNKNLLLAGDSRETTSQLYVTHLSSTTPAITALSKTRGTNNASAAVTVTAENFTAGFQFLLFRPGLTDIAAADITVLSTSSFSCTLPITGAAAGAWNARIINPDGKFSFMPLAFWVEYATPTVTAIAPSAGKNTEIVNITNLAGSGFKPGAAIKLVRAGYDAISCTGTVVSGGQLACAMQLWNAAPGVWDARGVNIDGKTAPISGAFTITSTSPTVTAVTPSVGFSSAVTVAVTLSGQDFLAGSSVTLVRSGKTDIAATAVTAVSLSTLTCSLPLANVSEGVWDLVITNPYNQSFTLVNAFTVRATTSNVVPPNQNTVVVYNGASGPIKADIPAGAFGETVAVAISSPSFVPPNTGGMLAAGVSMEITLDKPLQPQKPVALTLSYRPGDVAGLDETKLITARYDTDRAVWIPLIGCSVDTAARTVTCNTDHFSLFQLMQANAAADFSAIKYYPNPLRPANGPLYSKINFTNMPANTTIKIYTILGELVRTIDGDANGMVSWDGKDSSGSDAASGTYIVRLTGAGTDKIIKVAVQR